MGLIAKSRTKSRTAPSQHATRLSPDWVANGLPHMAAIARAAACSVAQRGKLRSSGFRGHDTLGIGSAMRSGDSTIRLEQVGFGTWALTLGLETVKGGAFDWILQLKALRSSSVSVEITTPTVLTKDGSQVHKDEYLEVRELVVAGLETGALPSLDPELRATRLGLAFAPPPLTADSPSMPLGGIRPANEEDGTEGQTPIRDSDSILAPLLIGLREPAQDDAILKAVSSACGQVPGTRVVRKRMSGRKAVPVEHTRRLIWWHDESSPEYGIFARCIDQAPGESAEQAFGRWTWEIGLFAFAPEAGPAETAGRQSLRADVTRFKLQNGGVLGAHQLALFRHRLAQCFCKLDPATVMLGGQRGWSAEMWSALLPVPA